jgi:pimeloyl-ACP methyl ester carboxylesterase
VPLPDRSLAHVRLQGAVDKPVVVLLHGSMSSLRVFEPWAAVLVRQYRVISIDEPGHGLTGPIASKDYSRAGMVEFVHSVLKQLGVKRAAMVGHSMGGGVAAEYAERYPAEVWALVLIDAAGIPRGPGQGSGLDRMAGNAVLRPVLRWTLPRWMIALGIRRTFADPSQVPHQLIDEIYELTHYPGNRAGLIGHYLAPNDDAALEAGLSTLSMPTLIEWGAADRVLPVSSAREFQSRIGNARLIVYPSVGHVPLLELPQQSAADAAAFLDETSRSPR